MQIAKVMQPETYRQKLRHSFQLYQLSLPHVFLLALLIAVLAFIPRLFTLVIGQEVFATLPLNSIDRVWLLLADLTWMFFFAALLWRMVCIIKGKHEKIMEDLVVAFRKIPFIILAALIEIGILLALSLTLFLFYKFFTSHLNEQGPAFFATLVVLFLYAFFSVYLFFLLIFYFPLIVIEEEHVLEALKKSIVLVWGHFWQTFCFLLTPALVYLIILILMKYVLSIGVYIFFTHPSNTLSWLATLGQIVIFAFYIPWYAAVLLIQLCDLEARKGL